MLAASTCILLQSCLLVWIKHLPLLWDVASLAHFYPTQCTFILDTGDAFLQLEGVLKE